MPSYRMIAIDLDGTLLSPDGTVSPRNKAAIHKALAAGLLVCFATGRNFTESQMVLDAVEHYSTAVFVGGAMVIDTKNRKTLHRMGMQPQLAREICGVFESLGHAALALQDTALAGVDYLATADVKLDAATSQWMEVTAAKVKRISGEFQGWRATLMSIPFASASWPRRRISHGCGRSFRTASASE